MARDKKATVSFSEPRRLAGEKMVNTITPVRFVTKAKAKTGDEKDQAKFVGIPVKINPEEGGTKTNTTQAKIEMIDSFADAGESAIVFRRELDIKVFSPLGLQPIEKLPSSLRYMRLALGTAAIQQLAKAVSQAFVDVSFAKDPTMTLVERSNMRMDEKSIFDWLGQPRSRLWDGLTAELQQEAIAAG